MITTVPGLMDQIRGRFAHVERCPFQGERVFFENAGGALTLKSVVERSAEFAAIPDNQGRDNPASHALVQTINQAKTDARAFFGAPEGQIFAGESGTELLFRLIRSACLGTPEGGQLIGSTFEHPATRSAAARWTKIAGKDYACVNHQSETGLVTAADYAPRLSAKTRVATILHASPVTGMAVDVAAIAREIRAAAPECLIIVDGIQHAAHGQIDIASYDIDGYVVSPYKVFSRHGYGLAWVSDRLAELPHDHLLGAPGEPWEQGTRDTGSYATFSAVVDYFDWLGSHFTEAEGRRARIEAAGAAIHKHEKMLTGAMLHGTGNYAGLADMAGVQVIGGADNPAREGLVSFHGESKPALELVAALSEQGIRVHVRKADHYSSNILTPLKLDACVRVSLCHYNTLGEVTQFLGAMKSILG